MLGINMEDLMNVLRSCMPYLIFFGVVLVLAIIAMVFSAVNKKLGRSGKYMVRAQAGVAILLAFVIAANLIALGPVSNLIDLAAAKEEISQESIDEASLFGVEVAEEGIMLLENKDSVLPLAQGSNLNVFGWASTNPCYGGSGSGGISDAYDTKSILEGLTDAGFQPTPSCPTSIPPTGLIVPW